MNRRRADGLGGGLAVGRGDRSGRGNENEDPGPVQNPPITYAVRPRQRLSIAAGGSILTFALPAP
jgi:hypothetical protein